MVRIQDGGPYAGIVQRLEFQFAILKMRVRFPLLAPYSSWSEESAESYLKNTGLLHFRHIQQIIYIISISWVQVPFCEPFNFANSLEGKATKIKCLGKIKNIDFSFYF